MKIINSFCCSRVRSLFSAHPYSEQRVAPLAQIRLQSVQDERLKNA